MSNEIDPLWDGLKQMSKDNKEKRIKKNLSALDLFMVELDNKNISTELKGNALLFRESSKPKVDYYYSKGNWRVNNTKYKGGFRMMYGGYKKFLNWYESQ